jgi:non-ribosomal peptide synthetase-like protein
LHTIFEEQARETPTAIALEVPPRRGDPRRVRVTYAELDERAGALARRLAPRVRSECVVAIVLPRAGVELPLAQLAVLKAGAAWTCIEPDTPRERLAYLLEDSRAVAVIAGPEQRAALLDAGCDASRIVDPAEPVRAGPARGPEPGWLGPETLAYVIYTSGTTGPPKGVMIEHRSVANLVLADKARFGLGPSDRCAQTSSAAYDSSVEEMWLAWGTGATLVMVDDERVRSGPDLLPWLREEGITVWCPAPTMLRMTCSEDPQRDLPDVRLVYVGGEELTPDVAERWSPGRWLENGYGPTECTVTVTRTRTRPGEPVTIGRPIPGHRALVLDAQLAELPDGQVGELWIAGVGVARGYLGRPDLTRERFVELPGHGRSYRTGDLVRRLPGGDLAFLGRADTQVKIRGHRIELTAVESELCRFDGVIEAACRVQANGSGPELVAFVVTSDGGELDDDALRDWLRRTLPEPMLPSRFARLDALPRAPLSGKLDRRALPELECASSPPAAGRRAEGPDETAIAAAFEHHLPAARGAGVEADFFLDLGGNSLLAAQVISELRRDPRLAALTVRDVYEARTVAGLARRVPVRIAPAPGRADGRERVSRRAPWGVVAQVLVLAVALIAAVNTVWWFGFRAVPALAGALGTTAFVLLLPTLVLVAALIWTLLSTLLTLACKRLLIGRYAPGSHPYLGSMYVRHWVVSQLARCIPWELLESTGLRVALLRALGARIGSDVHLHRGVALHHGGWDLLEIGDGAALGRDVSVGLVTYDRQELVFAPIRIGRDATLDTRARMGPGSELGNGAFLSSLATLAPGASVPADERWDGVPAACVGESPPAPPASAEPPRASLAHTVALLVAKALVAQVTFLPAMSLAAVVLAAWQAPDGTLAFTALPLGALALAIVIGYALSLPLQALLCRLLGRIEPGSYPVRGNTALTVILKERLVETANVALSGTLAWPIWLRWAGMRVGRRCEISTIMEVTPELVEIADDCFFADGIYLGRPLVHRGHLVCERTTFSPRTFLGNHAVIPAGARLPGGILLGVSTVADPARIRAETAWFGHPAFELPRRERLAADPRLTFRPSPIRYANRVMWESLRLVLPVLPAMLVAYWATRLPALAAGRGAPVFQLMILPLAAIATGLGLCALTLAVKWSLLGRMRETRHMLWSCWCSRWDFLFEVWSAYARPVIECLEGTPFVAGWLRAMGARIGSRVVLGTSLAQIVDPDMLEIGDDATVCCHLQLHSFEDRVLKLGRSRIGPGSTVGAGALILYGAEIGEGAHVGEGSVVMKHERLLPGHCYEGAPTRPVVEPVARRGAA